MQDKIDSSNHNKNRPPVNRHIKIESVTRYVVNHNYVRNCPASNSNNRVPVSLARVRFLEKAS
jgi:hypothetical protein